MQQDDDLFEQERVSRSTEPTGYIDWQQTTKITMETHIPESNIGYKMMQKMGWIAGSGLGSHSQGRVDPILIEVKDETLGVGKAQELEETHVSSTAKRRALDSEKQLEETEIQRIEREYRAEKKQAIMKELEQVKRMFYCELCDKQYNKISEYEQHLQSYDHHHKKRFKEMKESTRNSELNQSERERRLAREKKREERELKRMQEAIQKKIGTTSATSTALPMSTVQADKGSWTAAPSLTQSGGWTNVPSSTPSGGWTDVSSKPSSERTSDQTSGGWATVTSISASTSTKISSNNNNNNNNSLRNSPGIKTEEKKETSAEAPKKLAFGLKKTGGFQFGLKKK
ncbi:hypothetical protein RMATCC62417_07647 [Rhizopus microsporus]|nr:hypothetical protein RMATCC62417_07647 [Rhizopus microsporus]